MQQRGVEAFPPPRASRSRAGWFSLIFWTSSLFSGPSAVLWADSCPYCGREYGEGPARDQARLRALRAAHEAVCSSNNNRGDVYADDVEVNYREAEAELAEATRRMREVAEVGATLAGQARALFDTLAPAERASLENALAAAMSRARNLSVQNSELELRLTALSREVTELRRKLAACEDRNWQLLRELETTQHSLGQLRSELATAESELVTARAELKHLEELAARQASRLAAARETYWQTAGSFFRDRQLGEARDYTPRVQPREPRTQREVRSTHPEVRLSPAAPRPAVAAVPLPVAAAWRGAFNTPDVQIPASRTTVPATAAELRNQIDRWDAQTRKNAELAGRVRQMLIETSWANDQLNHRLEVAAARERARGVLDQERRELRVKLQWACWELEISTRTARQRMGRVLREWREEQVWDLSQKILVQALRDKNLGHSAYAQLRLAYDLVDRDLPQVPQAVRDSDNPEVRGLVRRLESLDQQHGVEFLRNLFDIPERPLKGQLWIERLLGLDLDRAEAGQ